MSQIDWSALGKRVQERATAAEVSFEERQRKEKAEAEQLRATRDAKIASLRIFLKLIETTAIAAVEKLNAEISSESYQPHVILSERNDTQRVSIVRLNYQSVSFDLKIEPPEIVVSRGGISSHCRETSHILLLTEGVVVDQESKSVASAQSLVTESILWILDHCVHQG